MMIVCHHLNPEIPADMAFADSRIRPSTMAAEDLLHDMGAISMMSSDAQAMGRIGEMIMRTWQTAHVMKCRYGALPEDLKSAKVRTIDETEHSSATGCTERQLPRPPVRRQVHDQPGDHARHRHEVGSVEPGKLADLVLWEPKFFGVKPHMVLKGGQIAYAQVGDANASITTPQPYLPRAGVGLHRPRPGEQLGQLRRRERGRLERPRPGAQTRVRGLGLARSSCAITDTREVTKADMKLNDAAAGEPRSRPQHLRGHHRRRDDERRPHRDSTVRPYRAPTSPKCPWRSGTSSSDPAPARPSALPLRPGPARPDVPARATASPSDSVKGSRSPMSRAALLVLADGRFPAGGHAHSGGVEAAVAHGAVHDTAQPGGVLPRASAHHRSDDGRAGRRSRRRIRPAAAGRRRRRAHPRPRTARRRPQARPADDARGPRHLPSRRTRTPGRRASPGRPPAHRPGPRRPRRRARPRWTPPTPPRTRASAARPPQRCAC